MDGASTVIVVIIFVATIFTSLGGQTGHTPKKYEKEPPKQHFSAKTKIENLPDPKFYAVIGGKTQREIADYIAKYRSAGLAHKISQNIMIYGKKYDVNPKLVAALMFRESRYNPKAVSSSGAMGLGQLLPSTAKSLGVTDGFDVAQNTRGTVRYMSYLLTRFKKYGDRQIPFAIAGYLEGPNGVERKMGMKPHSKAYVKDIIEVYYKI